MLALKEYMNLLMGGMKYLATINYAWGRGSILRTAAYSTLISSHCMVRSEDLEYLRPVEMQSRQRKRCYS